VIVAELKDALLERLVESYFIVHILEKEILKMPFQVTLKYLLVPGRNP